MILTWIVCTPVNTQANGRQFAQRRIVNKAEKARSAAVDLNRLWNVPCKIEEVRFDNLTGFVDYLSLRTQQGELVSLPDGVQNVKSDWVWEMKKGATVYVACYPAVSIQQTCFSPFTGDYLHLYSPRKWTETKNTLSVN